MLYAKSTNLGKIMNQEMRKPSMNVSNKSLKNMKCPMKSILPSTLMLKVIVVRVRVSNLYLWKQMNLNFGLHNGKKKSR